MDSGPHGVPKEFNSLMEVYSHIFHISNIFPILLTLHSSSLCPRIVLYTIHKCEAFFYL